MQLGKPRVLERLMDVDALTVIELQHPLHQVDRQWIRIWKFAAEVHFLQEEHRRRQWSCSNYQPRQGCHHSPQIR